MATRRTLGELMLQDSFQIMGSRPSGRSVFSVGGSSAGLSIALPGGTPNYFSASDPTLARVSGGGRGALNLLRGGAGGPLTNPLSPAAGGASVPTVGTGTGGDGGGLGALAGTASGIACGAISNATARAFCIAATQYATGKLANRGTGAGAALAGCPDGYNRDPKTGGCVISGLGSYLPGDIGRADTGWTPVAGLYGVGVTPLPVARTVRECPAGFVLGKDGVCYDHLARTARAHNPGARPLLTGGDMNALRRARQLEKKIGKISRTHGKKVCSCGPKRAPRKK